MVPITGCGKGPGRHFARMAKGTTGGGNIECPLKVPADFPTALLSRCACAVMCPNTLDGPLEGILGRHRRSFHCAQPRWKTCTAMTGHAVPLQ